ncbi:MAG: hypothetical protein BJ554DRAFT_3926, partial [Olpidium bornovanus]
QLSTAADPVPREGRLTGRTTSRAFFHLPPFHRSARQTPLRRLPLPLSSYILFRAQKSRLQHHPRTSFLFPSPPSSPPSSLPFAPPPLRHALVPSQTARTSFAAAAAADAAACRPTRLLKTPSAFLSPARRVFFFFLFPALSPSPRPPPPAEPPSPCCVNRHMSRPPAPLSDPEDEPPLPYALKSARCPYYPPSLPSQCVHLVPPSPAPGQQPAGGGQSAAEHRPHQLQILHQPPPPQQQQQRAQSTSPTARIPRSADQQHPTAVFYAAAAAAAAAKYQEYPRSPQSEAVYAPPPPPLLPPPPPAHPFRHQEEYFLSAAAQTSPSLPCAPYDYPRTWRGTLPPDQQATIAGPAVAGSQHQQRHQLQQQSTVAVPRLVHHWPWPADVGQPPPPELLGFQYPAAPAPSTAPQYAAVPAAAPGLARPRYPLPRPSFYLPIQDDAGASELDRSLFISRFVLGLRRASTERPSAAKRRRREFIRFLSDQVSR